MLCTLFAAIVVPLSLLLAVKRKRRLSLIGAFHLVDLRNKKKVFKVYLVLFVVMGLFLGLTGGFVYPLFLEDLGFNAEKIGVFLGLQLLLAGLVSYLFVGRFEVSKVILFGGLLYTFTLILIGCLNSTFAGVFVIAYGIVEGLLAIGQEGILTNIVNKESYGTDIGLIWIGYHCGRAFSLAIAGALIYTWDFVFPFLLSAFGFIIFYLPSFFILREKK